MRSMSLCTALFCVMTLGQASAQFTEDQQRQAIAIDDFFYRNRLENDRRYRERQRQAQLRLDEDQRRWSAEERRFTDQQHRRQEYDQALEDHNRRLRQQEYSAAGQLGRERLYLKNPTPENIAKARVLEQEALKKFSRSTASRKPETTAKATVVRARTPAEVERARKQLVQEHLRQIKQLPAPAARKKQKPKKTQRKADDDDDD